MLAAAVDGLFIGPDFLASLASFDQAVTRLSKYSQYRTTIAVPAATNANRAVTIQSRRESFFIFPTLKAPPQLAAGFI
jgi:hypothetical protein